jgi:hypothetical protein
MSSLLRKKNCSCSGNPGLLDAMNGGFGNASIQISAHSPKLATHVNRPFG